MMREMEEKARHHSIETYNKAALEEAGSLQDLEAQIQGMSEKLSFIFHRASLFFLLSWIEYRKMWCLRWHHGCDSSLGLWKFMDIWFLLKQSNLWQLSRIHWRVLSTSWKLWLNLHMFFWRRLAWWLYPNWRWHVLWGLHCWTWECCWRYSSMRYQFKTWNTI